MPEALNPTRIERKLSDPAGLLSHYENAIRDAGTFFDLEWQPPEKLHVTLMWSRTPGDWNDPILEPLDAPLVLDLGVEQRRHDVFGEAVLNPLTPRAFVLRLADYRLVSRHMQLHNKGLRSDFDPYEPHITLAKIPTGLPLDALLKFGERLEVFREPIALGPEIRRLP